MREFRKTTGRNSRPQVWKIWIDENNPSSYIIEWGLLNGAKQKTSDTPGSCGVVGHSDYKSSEQYVKLCINREIKKKVEQGYIEYINGEALSEVCSSINFNKLPKNLCFYKPKKEIKLKDLQELESQNRAVWTLKHDGMMHIIVKNGPVYIYSRGMDIVTEKFPHIVESVNNLNLPNGTILLGEICLLLDGDRDNFNGVSKICRSDSDLALAYQGLSNFPKRKKNEKILGKTCYYVFDVAFYDGKDLISNEPVINRLILLRKIFSKFNKLFINTGRKATFKELKMENKNRTLMLRNNYIAPLKIYRTNSDNDINLAKEIKSEGFVIVDVDMCYGNRAYSFDGKAQRPKGIWKRKPKYEQEFFITSIYEGTGRNRKKLGGICISQFNLNGEVINCGKCGCGFDDNDRIELWKNKRELINKTVKIEFDSRQPDNKGKYSLRFPVFIGFADKNIRECIME